MVRRNLFQPPAPPTDTASEPATPEKRQRFPNTGAMGGVKSTLKDLSSNAVRDIPPEMIDDGGPKDRLDFADEDIAQLADSIRAHGQQVPIMVRPLPGQPGHYRIVYGRRRLRALRRLGLPAKALVRSLSDAQAILAQGQENSQRLDPSFIEKALFSAELSSSGYGQDVIMDALAIDKPMLSRMGKVARRIPERVAQIIGPAHGIGRRRWEDLADSVGEQQLDLAALTEALSLDGLSSDERFSRVAKAVAGQRRTPAALSPTRQISQADGTVLAEVRDSSRALTVKLPKTTATGFADWLNENAETELRHLHDRWQKTRHGA